MLQLVSTSVKGNTGTNQDGGQTNFGPTNSNYVLFCGSAVPNLLF